jgi:hypothetical protein
MMDGRGEDMKDHEKSPDTAEKSEPMDTQTTSKRGKRGGAALGREIQAKIGQQLRSYYDGLIEPTPDRFVELLRQLDKPSDKGNSE